jgi:hypothetical protein
MKKVRGKSTAMSLKDRKLLEMVAKRLKGRVLFPEKVEEAKRLVKNVRHR